MAEESNMPPDHPVEIARRLFIAVNTEEVVQARDLHAKLGERLGERDRYREALEAIGTDCANYHAPSNCVNSGRTRGARYTADAWCDKCIARAALNG